MSGGGEREQRAHVPRARRSHRLVFVIAALVALATILVGWYALVSENGDKCAGEGKKRLIGLCYVVKEADVPMPTNDPVKVEHHGVAWELTTTTYPDRLDEAIALITLPNGSTAILSTPEPDRSLPVPEGGWVKTTVDGLYGLEVVAVEKPTVRVRLYALDSAPSCAGQDRMLVRGRCYRYLDVPRPEVPDKENDSPVVEHGFAGATYKVRVINWLAPFGASVKVVVNGEELHVPGILVTDDVQRILLTKDYARGAWWPNARMTVRLLAE